MAQLRETKIFVQEFEKALQYAFVEFGATTSQRWYEEYRKILHRLQNFPTAFTPVAELQDLCPGLRGATIMKNFKILFLPIDGDETVVIADLWDIRKHPNKLRQRWKRSSRLLK